MRCRSHLELLAFCRKRIRGSGVRIGCRIFPGKSSTDFQSEQSLNVFNIRCDLNLGIKTIIIIGAQYKLKTDVAPAV